MIDTRLKRCLEPGLSILVGSVDSRGVPSCSRAIALASQDDLETVTTYVPLATSQETIANVASTRRLAVAATHIVDHCSTQLKGTVTSVRLAREDESPFVLAQLDRFADLLSTLGLPKRIMRGVAHWPAFAIEMRVEEVYDQTPGPRAGSRLR
jgi:hypothetical protein